MAFGLLNVFFVFFANYFYFQKIFEIYICLHSLHIATVLWVFPSLYLYVKAVVSDEKYFRKELYHLLPGFFFGLTSAILFYGFLSQDERIFYLSNYRTGTQFSSLNLKILARFRVFDVLFLIIQIIYYSLTMIRIPIKYEEKLNEEFSNIENFSIRWVWGFVISFVTVGLLCIVFYMFNPFQEDKELFLVFFLFLVSSFTWIIGLWSFKQKRPEAYFQEPETAAEVISPTVNLKEENELVKKLITYFEKEKPYLQPDLNLTAVCKKIGTNRTYLSSVINSDFGMNFNTFVNKYRLDYADEFLQKYPGRTKEELARVAGFGSISSLKRAMNRVTEKAD